ncbi:RIBOSOMAL OXYGENASE 1 [Salix koriyanagi]|uniref:Bifunctional lysine-specific demethylase and histidyl-hydroxylase n=1 Tax=Salix koriyanagi TaxID=2511006 RepID=A0A9Q1A5E8_9ROSI|nr:RIBOSOMAL OXYGENASE 1 [Salix koriyanagi]
MEMEDQRDNSKKRTRKRKTSSLLSLNNTTAIFPLLLAAATQLSNSHKNTPNNSSEILVKKCLTKLHQSLLSNIQNFPTSVLSLFPILVNSKCAGIARRSAEIVGLASLVSLDMNELVALDEGIVKGLILMLGSEKRKVSVAACNALLDLSSTLIGRRSLLEFSALEWFMFLHLQYWFPLCDEDERSVACARLAFKEDGHAVSVLHAAITLINTCNVERLEKIPRKLSRKFLVSLKTLWENVHNQMLLGNAWSSCRDRYLNLSNVTVNSLAESIFRLSINVSEFVIPLPSVLVDRKIFGWSDLDELNIISFLEEVRSELGCPIVYEQDIRVIRTEQPSKKEVHFFQKKVDPCCFKKPAFNNMDIMQCEEAFKEGYTIALRGVEFRFASIATVADALASLFGQPSVGANIYLTPPNSQGLACHCDDHCVFVCQLFGTKQWSVYPQPNLQLPRLYDRFDRECCLGEQNSLAECRKFLLREGDILYIPRGFPHEACTHDDGSSDLARFSLHVTFGVEVEPPFDEKNIGLANKIGTASLKLESVMKLRFVAIYETVSHVCHAVCFLIAGGRAFAHVALHCWYKTQKQLHGASVEPLSGNLDLMSLTLLHLMIELIGASDSTLRKASLVGALVLPLKIDDWLYLNQKTTFNHIIDQINKASMFLEVFRSVEVVIEKNENPFHRMRWLRLSLSGGRNNSRT